MKITPPQLANKPSRQYLLAGALFGLMFPLFATLFLLLHEQLPFSWSTIVQLHTTRPLLAIINTAPIFLGLFATLAGMKQETVVEYNRSLQTANDRLVREIQEKEAIAEQLMEEKIRAERAFETERGSRRGNA